MLKASYSKSRSIHVLPGLPPRPPALGYSYNLSSHARVIQFHTYFCLWCFGDNANQLCPTERNTLLLLEFYRLFLAQVKFLQNWKLKGDLLWFIVLWTQSQRDRGGSPVPQFCVAVCCCSGRNEDSRGLTAIAWIFLAIFLGNSNT